MRTVNTMEVVIDGKTEQRPIDYVDTTSGFGPPRYIPVLSSNERIAQTVGGTTYIFKVSE